MTEIIKSPQSHEDAACEMRVEHCSIESGMVGHAWNLYRTSREGCENENENKLPLLAAERRERASITFIRRATPFTSVKFNRQVNRSVITSRDRDREGGSDMAALVGSLRAVYCPYSRA